MAQGLHAPALGLNTIKFKYVYWCMKQISGERLQDHWSSGSKKFSVIGHLWDAFKKQAYAETPCCIKKFAVTEVDP